MYCVNCSDYDAEYRGGWCDWLKERKNPNDTCDLEDNNSRSYEKHTCSECSDFDPNYKGGYCNYLGTTVSPDGTCNNFG